MLPWASIPLAVAGVVLAYLGQWSPGAVLIAGAIALALIRPRPTHVPGTDSLLDMVAALQLGGKAIFQEGIVFLPARSIEPKEAPPWDGHTRLHRSPPGIGVHVRPLGHELYARWQQEQSIQPGLEGAALAIKQALTHFGLAKKIHVETGKTLRVRYRGRLPEGDLASIGGDATISLIGLILAQATQKPWRLESLHSDVDVVVDFAS